MVVCVFFYQFLQRRSLLKILVCQFAFFCVPSSFGKGIYSEVALLNSFGHSESNRVKQFFPPCGKNCLWASLKGAFTVSFMESLGSRKALFEQQKLYFRWCSCLHIIIPYTIYFCLTWLYEQHFSDENL